MKRILLVLCVPCLFAVAVHGQQRFVELRTANGSDVAQLKLVEAVIRELDEAAIVSVHEDKLKLKVDASVQGRHIVERLAQNGLGDFVCVQCDSKLEKAATEPGTVPPVWNGDPATESQHAIIKQQWAAQHPDAYQRYLLELRNHTPASHE